MRLSGNCIYFYFIDLVYLILALGNYILCAQFNEQFIYTLLQLLGLNYRTP
jgi:hypothetical protein